MALLPIMLNINVLSWIPIMHQISASLAIHTIQKDYKAYHLHFVQRLPAESPHKIYFFPENVNVQHINVEMVSRVEMGIYLVAKVACVTLHLDANARENVKSLILLANIMTTVTTKVGVRRKLDYVFAKILTNVFMVLYAIAIRIVAKEAGVILNLNLDACADGKGKNLNDRDCGRKGSC